MRSAAGCKGLCEAVAADKGQADEPGGGAISDLPSVALSCGVSSRC